MKYECTLAPAVWAWIFSITNNLYVNTVGFSPPLVLLKHGLPTGAQHARSNAVTRFLINIALNEIWAARNLHTFEGKPSTASLVINKIKYRVRARIRAAYNFNFTSDFLKSWGHKGLLCKVENKILQILI